MLGRKNFAGDSGRRQRKEVIVPFLDTLYFGQMFPGVLLSDDLCSNRMQPLVAVGMIEMPMGVDQMCDRIGTEIGESLRDLGTRDTDSSIHKHLAIGTCQHGNVSPGPFEHADVVSQLMRQDGRNGCAVLD